MTYNLNWSFWLTTKCVSQKCWCQGLLCRPWSNCSFSLLYLLRHACLDIWCKIVCSSIGRDCSLLLENVRNATASMGSSNWATISENVSSHMCICTFWPESSLGSCEQQDSDMTVDAQADLSLHWAYMSEGTLFHVVAQISLMREITNYSLHRKSQDRQTDLSKQCRARSDQEAFFQPNCIDSFLFPHGNICCRYSSQASHQRTSREYP